MIEFPVNPSCEDLTNRAGIHFITVTMLRNGFLYPRRSEVSFVQGETGEEVEYKYAAKLLIASCLGNEECSKIEPRINDRACRGKCTTVVLKLSLRSRNIIAKLNALC